jgi:hypothetical protein
MRHAVLLPLLLFATGTLAAEPKGIWLSQDEVAALPTVGPAWMQLKKAADLPAGKPDLSDQNQMNNVYVLAKALVHARTGQDRYRREVIDNCLAAIDTERGGKTLALGRELCAYVIAADLVRWSDAKFVDWLERCQTERLQGKTLVSTHLKRPNNWGTHAGASRIASVIYLRDYYQAHDNEGRARQYQAELGELAAVFRGFVGDRASYAEFEYDHDLSWQADPVRPVGINPKGAMKSGHSIDGVLPDDLRRGGGFQWPPTKTGYPWEAMQGIVVQAELLRRQGYDAFEWEDRAVLRAAQFLHAIDWPAEGDDQWQPWLLNKRYGTKFPAAPTARPGKNMGWTNWTHQ